MTEELKAKAKEYFAAYPTENVIHITSDGNVFLQKNMNDAVVHQRQFMEKNSEDKLITIYRKQLVEKVEPPADEKTPDNTWKNPEIVEWLKKNGVEKPANTKKDDLLAEVKKLLDGEEEQDIPDDTWEVADIVKWLNEHNEEATADESKEDLLLKVNLVAEELADQND